MKKGQYLNIFVPVWITLDISKLYSRPYQRHKLVIFVLLYSLNTLTMEFI